VSAPVASNYHTFDAIWPAEHPSNYIDAACVEQLAYF
jgi:hypothetical protein